MDVLTPGPYVISSVRSVLSTLCSYGYAFLRLLLVSWYMYQNTLKSAIPKKKQKKTPPPPLKK